MFSAVSSLGQWGLVHINRLGRAGLLLSRALLVWPGRYHAFLVQQIYAEGVLSLVIIIIASLFIGMVLALQGYHTLAKFGASPQLGPLVALSVVRELGPVVTAILFAGRAGSALTAEIGLMKATEQIASLEMMAVDPLYYVIAPRLWSGLVVVPLLTLIFNMMAIYGAYLVGVQWLGVDGGIFWSNMHAAIDFRVDIINGVLKSIVFGLVVTWIAVFEGYDSVPTTAGIAEATTRSVVYASLAVLGLDFLLTTMMIGEW